MKAKETVMAQINPAIAHPEVLAFLKSRRSRPAKTLTAPVPARAEIEALLEIAARSPDHGKLEPWRFIVLEKAALTRLADMVSNRAAALTTETDKTDKAIAQFATADLVIAVISTPKESSKIPMIEQVYSAGAVCLALVNAALASGWGANWLSGWASHDRVFVRHGLGLSDHESVAGLIHIGTETTPPPERPRPNVPSLTTWVTA